MFKLLITILFLSVSFQTIAQYNETIVSSRPGQAVVPSTVGKSIFQVQSGISVGGIKNEFLSTNDFWEQSNTVRLGLNDRLEIRSTFKFRHDKLEPVEELAPLNLDGVRFGGFSFLNFGFRYNIQSSNDYKPSFGFQTEIGVDLVDADYQVGGVSPSFMFIYGQKLSNTFYLTSNWGVSWVNDFLGTTYNYVLNISFPIKGKLSGFVENYGNITNDDFTTRWDTGLGLLINTNLQLDLSGGFGRNEISTFNRNMNDWFIDTGVSWRLNTK